MELILKCVDKMCREKRLLATTKIDGIWKNIFSWQVHSGTFLRPLVFMGQRPQ